MADNDSRAGKRYDTEAIRRYVDNVHAAHDPGLEAAFAAPLHRDMPAIMVAPSEGKMLEVLLRMIRAERVVEVGTLAGYAAIRMAAALPPSGKLWSIELNPAFAEVARDNIARAGYADRVEVVVGAGLDILPTLSAHGPFDAMFVDADKENYDGYGRWAARNLRQGGVLIGDNSYLFGELLDGTARGAAMRRFHEEAAEHFHSVCIPTPDGILLGVKK